MIFASIFELQLKDRKKERTKMASSTSLNYYLVYCPTVMLASCFKSVKEHGHHHDANANGKKLHKKERDAKRTEKVKDVMRETNEVY